MLWLFPVTLIAAFLIWQSAPAPDSQDNAPDPTPTPAPDGSAASPSPWNFAFSADSTAEAPAQLPGLVDSIMNDSIGAVQAAFSPAPAPGTAQANERAFLDMIAFAEGTGGPNGYRTMFGGSLFDDFADHPHKAFQFTDKAGRTLWTTAAGRYQFMAASPIPSGGSTKVDTWGVLKAKLGLPDFSPASQDAAALELIRERGALADVQAGRVAQAVAKIAPVWASMPGAGYAQSERKLTTLVAQYSAAGGNLEA